MGWRGGVGIGVCIVAALSWIAVADVESAEAEVAEIQQAIAAAGANWSAGVTPISVLSAPERAARCGDLYEAIPEESKQTYARRRVPLRRYGDPEEVAQMTLNLCLPASSYVNGAVIPVDGGMTVRHT